MFIRKASDGDEGGQQLLWEGRLLFEQIDKASMISVGSAERDEIIRDSALECADSSVSSSWPTGLGE